MEYLPGPFSAGLPDAPPPEYGGAPRAFGWPAAVALIVLVIATYGFSFALLRTGSDPKSAVVIPLLLLFGAGLLIVPVANTKLRTRIGEAAKGAYNGARGKK
ncbi:hypothetical protein [Amycolatopsis sp. NPDC021455]|uniref:hypothetical protein n=1 Tax=Amycolatopsis sp. NPDC021455 TaxID=3154901 RepID=UPI0033ECB10C